MRVPPPVRFRPTVPARLEEIVSDRPAPTVTVLPVRVSVPPVIVSPVVLNVRPPTEAIVPLMVMVPGAPPKTAVLPATQATSAVPLYQSGVVPSSHVPVPPLPPEPQFR